MPWACTVIPSHKCRPRPFGKSLVKRLLKGPWLWIVVAVVGVLIALQYLTPSDGHDEITTSEMQNIVGRAVVQTLLISPSQLQFLPRKTNVFDARCELFQRPFDAGNRCQNVRLDL